MFKKGDIINHHCHGIGTIKQIREAEMLRTRRVLVTVHFERNRLEVTMSKQRLRDSARNLLSSQEARVLIGHLADSDKELATEYRVRHRNNQLRLTSGDPYQLCDVITGLARLRKRRGSLSHTDDVQLRQAVDLLSGELALALDCKRSQQALEQELLLLAAS